MSDWLDGPRLVDWLLSRGLRLSLVEHGPTDYRALIRWRQGGTASVYVLDRILVREGLSLGEIPSELWVEADPRSGGRDWLAPQLKKEIVQRRLAGEREVDLSREFGISPRSIRTWKRNAKLKAAR